MQPNQYESLRQRAIENYKNKIEKSEAAENNRTDFQKLDLSPIAALIDSETGSNFSRTYDKPLTESEVADKQAGRYQSLLKLSQPKGGMSLSDKIAFENIKSNNKVNRDLKKYGFMDDFDESKQDRKYGYDSKTLDTKQGYDAAKTNAQNQFNMDRDNNRYKNLNDRADKKADLTRELLGSKNEAKKDLAKLKSQNKSVKRFKGNEYQAGGFAVRAEQANLDLSNTLNDGFDPTSIMNSTIQGFVPESQESTGFKKFDQSKRNFISAVLRKESGASISPTEFANEEKKYFHTVGDDDETLAQKDVARRQAIASLKAEAGGAYDEVIHEFNGGDSKTEDVKTGDKIKIFMQKNGITDPNQAIEILKGAGKL